MSRTRFKALMAMLHVVDPTNEDESHKLRKVESFINYFESRGLALYQPSKNLTFDERLVKSCHWSEIRQYIKDKPTRWGIKLWVLADSSNGYTADFNVYIGKAARKETKAFSKSGLNIKHLFAQGVLATGAILKKQERLFSCVKKVWGMGS